MKLEMEKAQNPVESPCPRVKKRDGGAYILEFALLIPIFVLMMTGMVDFGRAYLHTHVLLDAAQAGARVGSMPKTTTAQVNSAVNAVLNPAKITGANIVSGNVGDAGARGSTTSVIVTAPFKTLSGHVLPGWAGTLNLSQTVKLRHE